MFQPGNQVWTVAQDGQVKEPNLCVTSATWTGMVAFGGRPILRMSDGGFYPAEADAVFLTFSGAVFFLQTLVIRHHLEGRLGNS